MAYMARRMLKNARYYAGFTAVALLLLAVAFWFAQPSATPATPPSTEALVAQADTVDLSAADMARYRAISAAQTKGDFAAADAEISALENRGLMGYVLAERYSSSHYKPTTAELDAWLARYSDLPGASRIAALARNSLRFARNNGAPLKGDGYIDHLGRSSMPGNWAEGIRNWKNRSYQTALTQFLSVGDNEKLSPWQRAAGYYWAYRAADKAEDAAHARSALANAAQFKTTFYGLLANAQRNHGIALEAEAPEVSDALRSAPHAERARMLAQIGRSEQAESELRLLYAGTSAEERPGIITLASEMNLPNLQVRLANTPGLTPAQKLFASYPRPSFMAAQQAADPALLMAIARNESAFRSDAGSPAGAMGMMQMLPSTARSIERRMGAELADAVPDELTSVNARLGDAATAVRYGAEYIKILSAEPGIKGNLVRLLAGYNAGPAAVANWQSAANDPLLYIESIPYAETRNYVMQVLAQYWVYQSLDGEVPSTLAAITHGNWPQV